MRAFLNLLVVGSVGLVISCGEKKTAGGDGEKAAAVVQVAEKEETAAELGFASRVPADSDFYFSAHYDEEEIVAGVMDFMQNSELVRDALKDEVTDEELAAKKEEFADVMEYFGSEVFVFSGSGVGGKLKMLGTSYRELSAASAGFAVSTVLDLLAETDEEPDFEKLGEGISEDLLGKWLAVLEEDSKLLVPSVVMGWQPGEEKTEECAKGLAEKLEQMFKDKEGAQVVSFESYGAKMAGYEIEGTKVFGGLIAEMREDMEAKMEDMTYGEGLSVERMDQFLKALEQVKFTLASGVVDGRVLVYFGDGAEGFQLAEKAEDSLAWRDELQWMAAGEGETLMAAGYLSEGMVGAVLPWLDTSPYWEAIANAVGAPVVEQELFRKLFMGLSETAGELAQRDYSAWSGAVYRGKGLNIQTRGGIVDPSIDFEAPLAMREAVGGTNPGFRAHWVQARGWNELSWKRLEYAGFILQALGDEVDRAMKERGAESPVDNVEILAKAGEFVQGLNRSYREEFRNGIGDEVAVFGDFLGEVPPIPGVSQETVENSTMPRLLYARPVTDRAMLTKSGESLIKIYSEAIDYANGYADGMIPLIKPQKIESGGLQTWFVQMPFIGGDFVPGISLNDGVWMMGTSRKLAGALAEGMEEKSGSSETGVIIEVDFEAMVGWMEKIYVEAKRDVEAMGEEGMGAAEMEKTERAATALFGTISKLRDLKYRHWLVDGERRTSLVISLKED